MSIIFLDEATDSGDGEVGEDGYRIYTRKFLVISDTVDDGSETILTASGLPRRFNLLPSGSAWCQKVSASRQRNAPTYWDATASYTSNFGALPGASLDSIEGVKLKITTTTERRAVYVDKDGNPVLNSAGERITGLERDYPLLRLTMSGTIDNFYPGQYLEYTGAINSDPWMGGAARTWKCEGVEVEEMGNEEDGLFYEAQAQFLYDKKGWVDRLLDCGWRDITGKNILDPTTKDRIVKEWPLNGAGMPLSAADAADPTKWQGRDAHLQDELPFGPAFGF